MNKLGAQRETPAEPIITDRAPETATPANDLDCGSAIPAGGAR
ncbi:hypothetical protein [Rhodococcus sp. NPDC003383]